MCWLSGLEEEVSIFWIVLSDCVYWMRFRAFGTDKGGKERF